MHKIRIYPDEDCKLFQLVERYARIKDEIDRLFLPGPKKRAQAQLDATMAELRTEWRQEFPIYAQIENAAVMTGGRGSPYIEVKVSCLGP
jgi:hypothetical protein